MKRETVKVEVVAGVLLEKDNKFLLVQEGRGDKKGLWNWPAGKVEEGYTIEETAIKEAREESGFDTRIVRKLQIFHDNATDVVKHLFYAEIIGGNLTFDKDEIMDAGWFTLDELKNKEGLRGNWIIEGIEIFNNS